MFLRQSTAYTFRMGPFLDATDGVTPETSGLDLEDEHIRVSKDGANFIDKADATTATHDEFGYWLCVLGTTDTNTCGELLVAANPSGALAVFKTFFVIEEAIYDALFAPSATGELLVDVAKISGDATAANNLELMYDGTGYAGGTAKLGVDVVKVSGDSTSADNLELMYDGTGYVGGTAKLTVDVAKVSGDSTAADNMELMFDGTGYAGGTAKLGVDVVAISGDTAAANNMESYYDGTGYGIQASSASTVVTVGALNSAAIDDVWETDTLTETYATDNNPAKPSQLLYMILCAVSEFSISSTTITGKKLDGSTTAMTWTLNDATSPTSRTRAS